MNSNNSVQKWREGDPPPPNVNPNLRLVVNAVIILAIIIAASCGGLEEAMVGLILGRLL